MVTGDLLARRGLDQHQLPGASMVGTKEVRRMTMIAVVDDDPRQ